MSRTFRERTPWRDDNHRQITRLTNIADGYSCPRWERETDLEFLALEIAELHFWITRDNHHATSPVRLSPRTWSDPYSGKNRSQMKRLFHKARRARNRQDLIRELNNEPADHA